MFPYRRGNKKRGKGGPGAGNGMPQRRQRDGNGGGQGRRVPNSAHELLPLLQPTTKALAQVLAGNTRASGQVVHARTVLGQAERFIDERSVERLIPSQREEFLEQVARLKLTLADADAAEIEEEAQEQDVKPAMPSVSSERLRALALSLATVPADEASSAVQEAIDLDEVDDDVQPADLDGKDVRPTVRPEEPRLDIKDGSPRSARLRLKNEAGAGKSRENSA